MTPDDYPEVVRIYGSENPRPRIATLRFTPLCGEALFSTRIRLNGAQDVVAVMQTSRGEYWRASQRVSVTFGACATAGGGEEFGGDWQPSIRLSVPEKVPPGGIADIRTIITHPMESGLRLDTRNAYVPLRIIETLTVTLNGETALQTRLAPAISTNPYLAFRLRLTGASLIGFDWQDTTGEIYHREARVAA